MESRIIIYDKLGQELLQAPVTRECLRKRVLMGENHVLLVFNHDSYIDFRKGSYIIYKGFKFEIMTDVYPEVYRNGWKYSLQFNAKDGFLRKYNIFYRKQDIAEVAFALTTDLLSFGNVICDCINHELGGTNWRVKAIPAEYSDLMKTLSFKGEKLFDALTMIAEQFECEWWIEENGNFVDLCFGKLSFGTEEEFEEGKVVTSIPRKAGDDSDFGTRFFVYGSTRNLTSDYGQVEQGGTTNHISEVRLRLPEGMDHIDAWENLAPEDVVHQVVFLDDIYPKNTDIITKVETAPREIEGSKETFDAYIITAENTPFVPSDIIEGETLGCVFETGALQGQSFELKIDGKYDPKTWKPSDGFDKKFEIVHVMNGDIIVPNTSFKPEVRDKFIITGVKLPKERIKEAEQELLQAGEAWAKKKSQDRSVYDCPSNPVFCQEYGKNYDLGQKVRLVGNRFGVSGRSSRIQGYEKKLWNEYEAIYTVGDNSSYSRLKRIEGEIKESQYSERIGVVKGVGIYLIRNSFDHTQPTNYNAYSALASLEKFVTYAGYVDQPVRTVDDVQFRDILGRIITITDGFMTDDFIAGMSGAGVGVVNKAEVHADKVLVRKYLEVLALVVQKMYWRGGMQVLSPAGMKISRIEEFDGYWRCYMETEDGQTNDFTIGAQARCNAFGDVQKYYWRLVVGIGTDYIDLSKTDCDTGSAVPQIGDDVVQVGHRTDPNLQWAVIDSCFSADAGRTIYAGVNSYSLSDKWVLREGVGPNDRTRIGLFTRHGEFSDVIKGLETDISNAQGSAEAAKAEAERAQTAANEAQKDADAANTAASSAMQTATVNAETLGKINDDGTISPVEKTALRQQQADIQTEYYEIMASAGLYGISTTAYKTAYDLANAALTKYTAVSPEFITSGPDYANITAYYAARQTILNAVSAAANKKAEDAKTAADKAQDAADSAQTSVNNVKNIVDNLTGIIIPDLQNQVDGAIQSWDGEVEPTLNNYPANEWTDDAERSKHVGDTYIYYTTDAEGNMVSSRYNFRLVNGVYKWEKIADSVSAELEKDLRELTGTVGRKNSITYSNNVPTPPYNIDDLWIKEDNTIYICQVQKLEGMSSSQADWEMVNDAMIRLKNIADDNIITKEEKTTLRDTWSQIQKEFAKYQTQATTYSVPITTLQNAYNALNTFLTNTAKISQNTDTSITVAQKTQYNQLFADYYAARTDFANLIADKLAEGAVDNIQVGGVNILDGSTTGTGWIGYTTHVGTEFSKTSSLTTEVQVYSGNLNIPGGIEIAVSFYAKHTGNFKESEFFILPIDYATYGAVSKRFKSGADWVYNEFKLKTPEKWGIGTPVVPVKFRFDHNGSTDGTSSTVYLKDIQIEYGNKATTYSVPIKDQQEIAQNLADEAVDNLQIGSVNLISKKMMIRWNEKNKNIAVWGQDNDGIYLDVAPGLLYNITTEAHNPIFDIVFKPKTQYVFSIEWKHKNPNADNTGLAFYVEYNDGTRSNVFLTKDIKTKTITNLISEAGKTIGKIYSGYGTGNYNALIYNISLVEGNKPLQGFPVAEEDAIGSSVNLADRTKGFTITAGASSNHIYKTFPMRVKPNTVYHVQAGNIENLVGNPAKYTFTLYNKAIDSQLSPNSNFDKNGGILITSNNFEEQDGYLLCYAGLWGATAGNSVRFTEVMIVEGFYPAAVWTPSAGDVSKEISDVSSALSSFQGTVNGAFKDGIINKVEVDTIASNINLLNAEKKDIDAQYTDLYNNTYLISGSTAATNLYSAKVAYNNAHTNLINSINTAISDKKITDAEKADVNNKFAAYGTALATYQTRAQQAQKAIQDKVRESSVKDITKGSSYYVGMFSFQATYGIFKFATTIQEKSAHMLRVDIDGYCYGENSPFGISLVFYTYPDGLARTGYIINGSGFVERVRLGVKDGKVAIELKLVKDIYYPGFNINISSTRYSIPISYSIGWTGVGQPLASGDYIDDTYSDISVVPRVNSFADALANKAQQAADNAQAAINLMNDDSIFDIKEKQSIRTQWENINGSANTTGTGTAGSYYKTKSLATGLSVSALDTAYTALRTYLNGLALYTNSNTSNFARATMAAKFTAYYDAEIALNHAIADKLAKNAAKTVQVTANSQTFKYGYGYSGTPTPSSIVLTATARNFTPSSYQWQFLNGSTWTNISGATASTYTVSPGNTTLFPSGTNVRTFRCICNGDSSLSDQFTLAKLADGATGPQGTTGATGAAGKDAYTVLLTNEAHTFAGSTSAALAGSTTCQVIAYKGATRIAATIGSITGMPTGMSVALSSNGSTSAGFTVTVTTSMTTKSGILTVPVTVDGKAFTLNFSYALALKGTTGATGAAGNGIKSTVITYQASTSGTTAPTGTWSPTIPSVAAGSYLWTKTVINYNSGQPSEVYSVARMGTNGTNGNNGVGVSSTAITYKASTSGTTAPTGTWSPSIPSVPAGQYLWTKTVISYTNKTSSTIYSVGKIGDTGATGPQGVPGESINGVMVYKDPTFENGLNAVSKYSNAAADIKAKLTVERIAKPSDAPTKSGFCLKVTCKAAQSPGFGGVHQAIASRPNAVFIQKIIAKIPVGYSINKASNTMGSGYTDVWLTSTAGTGKYTTYLRKVTCGASGSFGSGGHIYISGSPTPTESAPLEWYIAYLTVFDQTEDGYADVAFTAKDEFAQNIGYKDLADLLEQAKTTGPLIKSGLINSNVINAGTLIAKNGFISALATEIFESGIIISGKNTTNQTKIESGKLTTVNMVATNATISGKITANEGQFGNLKIAEDDKNKFTSVNGVIKFESPNSGYTNINKTGTNMEIANWEGNCLSLQGFGANGIALSILQQMGGKAIRTHGNLEFNLRGGEQMKIYSPNSGKGMLNIDAGISFNPIKIYTTTTLISGSDGETAYIVLCMNPSSITVYLPSNPYVGQTIYIRRCNAKVTINGNGRSIYRTGSAQSSWELTNTGHMGRLMCYEGKWYANYLDI